MISILGLVIPFVEAFLKDHGQELPAELLEAGQKFYIALVAHKADLMTKAEWNAQRG